MNYITSCPKCDTQFLLNDELIKVHRGKVQCGSCELVFNAKTRLTEVADDITSTEEYQASIEEQASSETQLDENIEEIIIESDLSDSDIDNAEIDDYISSTSTASATIASPSAIDDFNKHVSKPRKAKQRNKHPILLG
ncbi:MAG: zinc-ribbon domain-containing protein, partial [Methylophilaceae bacterium]